MDFLKKKNNWRGFGEVTTTWVLLRPAEAEAIRDETHAASVDPGTGAEPRPQDSLYFHPVLNPTGAPPPGKPAKYRAPQPVYGAGSGRSVLPPESPAEGAGQGQLPPPQAGGRAVDQRRDRRHDSDGRGGAGRGPEVGQGL